MPPPAPQPPPTYEKGQLRILDLILGVPGASDIIRQVDYEGVVRWLSDFFGVGAGQRCSAEGQRAREPAYRQAIADHISRAFTERQRPELRGNFEAIYSSELQAIAWEMQSSWCVVFWLCVEGSWLSFGCQGDADSFQLAYNQEAKQWLNAEIDQWIAFRDRSFRKAQEAQEAEEKPEPVAAGGLAFFPALLVGGALMFWLRKRRR
jgi:hypothetical protein